MSSTIPIPVLAAAALAVFASTALAAGETRTLEDGTQLEWEVELTSDGLRRAHGKIEVVAPNERSILSGEFEHGLADGHWRFGYPNGKARYSGNYSRGERVGKWTFFHPNGEYRAKGRFEDGLPSGEWSFWSAAEELEPAYSGEYRAFSSDESRSEGCLLDGLQVGPWSYRWQEGGPMLMAHYLRGRPVGPWSFFHAEGTRDPDWITRDHGGLPAPEGLFEDPLAEVLALIAPAPPVVQPDGRGPLGLAPLDMPRGVDADSLAPLREALDEYLLARAGSPRSQELLTLLAQEGEASFVLAWNRMRTLELSRRAQVELGARASELLAARTNGFRFPWSSESSPEASAANALTILRWNSLFRLAHGNDEYLALAIRPQPGKGQLPPSPLAYLRRPGERAEPALARARRGKRARPADKQQTSAAEALEHALDWLAEHQDAQGMWRPQDFGQACGCEGAGQASAVVGVSALALLALQGGGSDSRSGPHEVEVRRALGWLLQQQDLDDGSIGGRRGQVGIYGHALAALALTRAYRSTRIEPLRVAAQRALYFIELARNPYGAWSYEVPPIGNNSTSVTAWMVQALAAGRELELVSDEAAFEGATNWFHEVTDVRIGRIGYRSIGSASVRYQKLNEEFPPEKGEAMTAAGLYCQLLMGADPEAQPVMLRSAELLRNKLPLWDARGLGCDMYYWYFGSHVMPLLDDKFARPWSQALFACCQDSQREDAHLEGSWDPIGPWGMVGGRVYSTAMMALCLEALLD